ncbi:MAG: hypothetical protein AAB354_00530 [candidate division KSB1 bacterium]
MNSEILSGQLLKIVHLLFVSMGIGGVIAQMHLLKKFRNAAPNEAAASERMALALVRYAEFYGFLVAFVTGLILAIKTGAFGTGGYLHVKTLLVLFLLGLGHVDMRNLKRMIALREAGNVQAVAGVKQTHLLVASLALTLSVVIVALVVIKPF